MAKRNKEDLKLLENIHAVYRHTEYTEDQYIAQLLADEIRYIENMSAKEPLNEQNLEDLYKGVREGTHIVEEKLDGVRADMQFCQGKARLFSRRISKKTNWYSENTDNFPWLHKYESNLVGTVIDGELTSSDGEFKTISSLCNCLWDEAILRQMRDGTKVYYNAFDIMYYKGINAMKLPLEKRKVLLNKVVEEANNPFIKLHPYLSLINASQYYEDIVQRGGEGVMIKDKKSPYEMKRVRHMTKVKAYDTWDVIIIGFTEPTKVYEGKEIDTWEYWEGDTPVTKAYYNKQIGTIRYGVIVTEDELQEWQLQNPKEKLPLVVRHEDKIILEVGECGGITDEERSYMTEHQREMILQVIEVGANDQMIKTGKLRHPRYVRRREDKDWKQCIWKDHIHKKGGK